MKFSEAWLREWVDPSLTQDELVHQLTMAGLEVDGIEPAAETFSGVVLARIETAAPHPDADKLQVCEVNDGSATYQVVCGAPNARAGLATAFARVGAVLPDNFKIKAAKLRGVESSGMLCSAAELGLGQDHDGIIELPGDLDLGSDLNALINDLLALPDSTIDLDLTPNRGDCLSMMGLAREVGVLNELSVQYPVIEPVEPRTETTFPVVVEAAAQCPRYLGRVIENVDLTQPSPLWMQERLRRCGLRSIDAVVDVTNYVLMELGQPMHAFDLAQLNDHICVRMAKPAERLTLLDGQAVSLDEQTLLITDAKGPVAMGGVMGGEHSGVSAQTQNVFLECAFFAPIAIAGTARRYGLHTDASHRYERGVDSELQWLAMHRATALLLDIVGGEPGPITEQLSGAHLPERSPVRLRQTRLDTILGVAVDPFQIDKWLQRLGFAVTAREDIGAGVTWQVAVPSHRFDIAIEADLIEEICRIYGYNNIPTTLPKSTLPPAQIALTEHSVTELKARMTGLGFQEVITYSFVDPKTQQVLHPTAEALQLAYPMSSEQSVMRVSLITGLLDAAKVNQARQQKEGRIFEYGQVFLPGDGQSSLAQPNRLAGLLWGNRAPENWTQNSIEADFFDLKGSLETLFAWSGQAIRLTPSKRNLLHPGQGADIWIEDQVVGFLGRLHPGVQEQLGCDTALFFEVDAAAAQRSPQRLYESISKFPQVRRDLAVVVGRDVSASELVTAASAAIDRHLLGVTVFDLYAGEGIGADEKSVALGLTLQSQTATLTEEEISRYAQQALDALQNQFGARLR